MFGGKFLVQIDKIGIWILMALVLCFVFTGYAMTKQIMDPVVARFIHTQILPIPLFIFFFIHVVKAVRNRFKKWRLFKDDNILDLYAYGVVSIVTLVLIGLFFR